MLGARATLTLIALLQVQNVRPLATEYMADHCSTQLLMTAPSMRLRYQRSTDLSPPTTCVLQVVTPGKQRLSAQIVKVDLKQPMEKQCAYDRVDVYRGNPDTVYPSTPAGGVCGSEAPSDFYYSTGDSLWLKFHSSMGVVSRPPHGFEVIFTMFSEGACDEHSEFKCCDGRCISRLLHADSIQHCADGSDEHLWGCPVPDEGTSRTLYLGLGISGGIGLVLIVVIVITIRLCRAGKLRCCTQRSGQLRRSEQREVERGYKHSYQHMLSNSSTANGIEVSPSAPAEYELEAPPPYTPTADSCTPLVPSSYEPPSNASFKPATLFPTNEASPYDMNYSPELAQDSGILAHFSLDTGESSQQ